MNRNDDSGARAFSCWLNWATNLSRTIRRPRLPAGPAGVSLRSRALRAWSRCTGHLPAQGARAASDGDGGGSVQYKLTSSCCQRARPFPSSPSLDSAPWRPINHAKKLQHHTILFPLAGDHRWLVKLNPVRWLWRVPCFAAWCRVWAEIGSDRPVPGALRHSPPGCLALSRCVLPSSHEGFAANISAFSDRPIGGRHFKVGNVLN